MERTFAFVDESGNHDLDTTKSGSSRFFVVCSVIIAEDNLSQAYELAEAVKTRHFQSGEIKSSRLKAKDADRRRRILIDLAELPLKLYLTVVDKGRVSRDGGLRFKKSFIKYVNNILYSRLFDHCKDLHLTVDEHGGLDFQTSLKKYVIERYSDDLFRHSEFTIKSSKDDVLIQVADFFAGTVAHIYEGKASDGVIEVYKSILRSRTIGLLEWPPHYQPLIFPTMEESAYADHLVYQQALKQATKFREKVGKHPDEEQRLQICILDYLQFRSEFVSDEYVSTEDIANHLTDRGFLGISDQKIRSSGIAKLRDADVIIASAPRGYKIPRSGADINDFLTLASSQILPLLDRIKKARDVYKLSSIGGYDILESEQFSDIRILLSSLERL